MANRAEIRGRLLQFLQEDTVCETGGISDATSLRDGLGLDSVDFVGIIMRIEGEYRIRLEHAELERLNSVGDLLNLVESKISSPAKIALAA